MSRFYKQCRHCLGSGCCHCSGQGRYVDRTMFQRSIKTKEQAELRKQIFGVSATRFERVDVRAK